MRATEYVENPFLWAKFGAVALGLANLVALHGSAAWRSEDGGSTPRFRRRLALAGGVSLAAWIAAVSAGRMIAYW